MSSLHIALSGYGKMGKEVEKTALLHGHNIIAKLDNDNDWLLFENDLKKADAVIDFSSPASAAKNIMRCFDLHLPVVVGTTGWDEHKQTIKARCMKEEQALLASPNFSIGVYLFMAAAGFLAGKMDGYAGYTAGISETHHIHKLDTPSGTALKLEQAVLEKMSRYKQGDIPMESFREGEVVGIHNLTFESPVDKITLRHDAKNRQGFATGAVHGAEWIQGRNGFFEMKDMMGF